MRACRSGLAAVMMVLATAGSAAAQPPFDCKQAKTPVEKAICGRPELASADTAMSAAYAALAKTLPPPQQAKLRADQRQWLKSRDGACAEATDDALSACLLSETTKRRRFLAGKGANGPAGAPPLLPAFYNEAKKGAYEITVAYPQFAPPTGAKFNSAVQKLTIAKKTLAEYRQDKPNKFNGSSNFYQVTYAIAYLDPRLVSVAFQFNDYQGGAHPNNWRAGVLWRPDRDAPVTLGDLLTDPEAAVPALSVLCKDKLEAEVKKDGWELFDNADLASVVGDAKTWAIDADGVTIMFDPYSIAAYAFGPHDFRLTYAELGQWLKPGGALPPGASH